MVTASYTGEWALFQDYCAATGQPSLPTTPAAVAGFLAALPARPATLRRGGEPSPPPTSTPVGTPGTCGRT